MKKDKDMERTLRLMGQARDRTPLPRPAVFRDKTKYHRPSRKQDERRYFEE